MVTAPVNTLFCVKVIGFAPELKLDKPATVSTPVCVIAPVALAVKFLPSVAPAKINPVVLVMLTSFAPLLFKVTAPVNTLFCVNVIGLDPELKLEVPGIVNATVCVIGPLAIAIKLLPISDAPKTSPAEFVTLTLLLPLLLNDTAPVNALFCVKVIGFDPAVKLDIPGTVNTPVCVIAPAAVADKLFPNVDAANIKPVVLVMLTLFAPLLFNETAPVNVLFCVSVIGNAPAVKLAAPGTVNAPVCVIAPLFVTIKSLPNVDAANIKGVVFVTLTSLAPLLLKVISPEKAFACVKVIGLLPALKFDVPGTTNAPVCVIGPPAVMDMLPPECKVMPARAAAALSYTTVKLRRFVRPKLNGGKVAPAFILRKFISLIFAKLPIGSGGNVPKSLASGNIMSELGDVSETKPIPLNVIMPD